MNVVRNEIRTGLLVLFSLAIFVGVLIYLGAPGVFTPQKEFGIYFENAAGLKIGTPVMLAGRKIGQVTAIASPVPNSERPMGKDGQRLNTETRVMVKVDKKGLIYVKNKVSLANYSLLSEPVIDFTEGDETSGLAPEGQHYVGERIGGLVDAGVQILDKIDPVLDQVNATLKSLGATADNLTKITNDQADLPMAFAEIRLVARHLNELTGPGGSLRKSLDAIESLASKDGEITKAVSDFRKLIAPESDLAKSIANVQKFTADLSNNKDVNVTLKNLRGASDRLNGAIGQLKNDFGNVADNLEQASDTVKRQPWRLIWPSTKKYPEDQPAPRGKSTAKACLEADARAASSMKKRRYHKSKECSSAAARLWSAVA